MGRHQRKYSCKQCDLTIYIYLLDIYIWLYVNVDQFSNFANCSNNRGRLQALQQCLESTRAPWILTGSLLEFIWAAWWSSDLAWHKKFQRALVYLGEMSQTSGHTSLILEWIVNIRYFTCSWSKYRIICCLCIVMLCRSQPHTFSNEICQRRKGKYVSSS